MKFLNRARAGALLVVLFGTIGLMFVGKEHILILENTSRESDGKRLEAFDTVVAKISEKEKIEFYEGETDILTAVGPYCTLFVEAQDKAGESVELSKRFYLGWSDRVVISIPQFVDEMRWKYSESN
jgi:predicted ATP-binding protein involved in virulence